MLSKLAIHNKKAAPMDGPCEPAQSRRHVRTALGLPCKIVVGFVPPKSNKLFGYDKFVRIAFAIAAHSSKNGQKEKPPRGGSSIEIIQPG